MTGALARVLVFLAASAVRLSWASGEAPPDTSTEGDLLAVDDACAEGGAEGRAECALNALQRRGLKALLGHEDADQENSQDATEAELEEDANGVDHPTIRLELYRAMPKKDLQYDLSNVDMGSVADVVNYLHTDVVGEHVGDYSGYLDRIGRDERLYGTDVIVSSEVYVRNPDTVIQRWGNFADMAIGAHFVEGHATGNDYNWDLGDVVGATMILDKRYPMKDPFYRVSLSGQCPNLKWFAKGRNATGEGVGACAKYSGQHGTPKGEILKGGLCPGGTEPGARPTGGPGCVYTYTKPNEKTTLSIDDLVGITKEDCGGHLCKNWADFRNNCTNHHYHRKFNYNSRRRYSTVLRTKTCVEYDIHKDCAMDCQSAACKKIKPNKRDLGLPFWKGRCSKRMNGIRSERVAQAFGVKTAGKSHLMLRNVSHDTCLSSATACHPNVMTGGLYCSREWSGICQPCYIPNTAEPFNSTNMTPLCPWNVLKSSDYAGNADMMPSCKSTKPQDLCCLYSSTCDAELTTDPPAVTDDGFAYTASLQDTTKMAEFLQRGFKLAYNKDISTGGKLHGYAYWHWGLNPIEGKSLTGVLRSLRKYMR